MASADQVRQLRDRIKQELPADTFEAEPWRLVWFLDANTLIDVNEPSFQVSIGELTEKLQAA